jgi:hypothetical protein
VLHAFFIGLMAKYYLDPDGAPSASELADGMRIVSERMLPPGAAPADLG